MSDSPGNAGVIASPGETRTSAECQVLHDDQEGHIRDNHDMPETSYSARVPPILRTEGKMGSALQQSP